MRIWVFATVVAAAGIPLVPQAPGEVGRGAGSPMAIAPADMKWEPIPGGRPGVMQVPLWGPPDGFHERFIRFPPGTAIPVHKHTSDLHIVVISGTYRYAVNGGPEKEYGPGSFVSTPGGTAHVAGCPAGCVFLEEVNGTYDTIPISR